MKKGKTLIIKWKLIHDLEKTRSVINKNCYGLNACLSIERYDYDSLTVGNGSIWEALCIERYLF